MGEDDGGRGYKLVPDMGINLSFQEILPSMIKQIAEKVSVDLLDGKTVRKS